MNAYKIQACGKDHDVIADRLLVGGNGLKFYRGEELVAYFLSWDYFIENSAEYDIDLLKQNAETRESVQ